MTVIYPKIPQELGCQVFGYLYDSDDASELGQDMVEVTTPNGVMVSCGWYPEGDQHGSYRVTMNQGFNQLLQPYRTLDIEAAASEVEKLVNLVCSGKLAMRSAAETRTFHVANFVIPGLEDVALIPDKSENYAQYLELV